jgi:2-iminobutanoate/2-iminopropanoate deaminase
MVAPTRMKLPKGKVWDFSKKGYMDPAKVFWSYGTKVRPGTTILFLAGCVPLDADGNLVGKRDMRAQVTQCLENIKAVLATEGATLKDVVNRRIFVTDMDAYLKAMDGWAARAYPDFWDRNPEEQSMSPGTLVEVSRLAGKDFMVEIEVFAAIDDK